MTPLINSLLQVRYYVLKGWTQGDAAIDESGRHCGPRDTRACAWCIVGAIQVATSSNLEWNSVYDALTEEIESGPEQYKFLVEFNDDIAKDVKDIVKIIDSAIGRELTRSASCPS